jgi:hypothetical protein
MRTLTAAAVALGLMASCATPAVAKSLAYAAGAYIQSVGGSGCLDTSGSTYAGVLQYGGLSGTTVTLRTPLPILSLMSTQVLTITSGQGGSSPSGTFTWKGVGPSGTAFNVSGTFSASVTTVDTNSVVFNISEHYGSCTETSAISATKVRPK